MQPEKRCPACSHMDAATLDKFLRLPVGTPGKRGPRSLAPVFGLDRRDIARHERRCLRARGEGDT